MINIVVPMAGRGSRFAGMEDDAPKPLIEVMPGKAMIEYVIDYLTLPEPHRFIFVWRGPGSMARRRQSVPRSRFSMPSDKINLRLGLFRSIVDGFRHRPWLTLRHIWTVNPYVRRTCKAFSLRVHGEGFLQDFMAASREAGMKPFLMWGTLLGFVREGRLLKHDKDIDMGILAADWPKRHMLIEAVQKRGYECHDLR